jgi:hypothetical protein
MLKNTKLIILLCAFSAFGLSASEVPDSETETVEQAELDTTFNSLVEISSFFDFIEPLDSSAPPKLRPMPDDDPGIPPGKWSCPDWPICEMYENN